MTVTNNDYTNIIIDFRMNCPSRVDPEALPNGWNQNPDLFAAQLNSDTNATSNRVRQRHHKIDPTAQLETATIETTQAVEERDKETRSSDGGEGCHGRVAETKEDNDSGVMMVNESDRFGISQDQRRLKEPPRGALVKTWHALRKYIRFVGPGWMVSVAYIDPGRSS